MRGFETVARVMGKEVKLPERSTDKSAGYDFFSYEDVVIPSILFNGIQPPFMIKTGIKAYMEEDEWLALYNRSSNPKKLGLILANSVGVIDSDYYNNQDNEGEIAFAFYNIFPFPVKIKKGDKIGQGVFSKFLKVDY